MEPAILATNMLSSLASLIKNSSNATENYYELKTDENIGFLILRLIIILLVYGGF